MSKELAVISAKEYAALSIDQADLAENLKDVLAGESFGVSDFDVVTVPTGASAPMWNLPSGDPLKVITGIVIHQNLSRTMWLTPIDKQGDSGAVPPDCLGAPDPDLQGDMSGSRTQLEIYEMWSEAEYVNRPATVAPRAPQERMADHKQPCDLCPFAQFGTAGNGKGQFCNLKRILYILTPDNPFPLIVRVPSKSLKAARKYLLDLPKTRKKLSGVVTHLALTKVPGNPAYYVIDFQAGETLDPETAAKAQAYAQAMKPYIEKAKAKAVFSPDADPEY